MSIGLFPQPSVHGPRPRKAALNRQTDVGAKNLDAGRAVRSAIRRDRIAAFADLIAEGVTVKDAAKLLGVSVNTGTSMMAEMRRDLGWQAA